MEEFRVEGRRLLYKDEGRGRVVLILHGAHLVVGDHWGPTVEALLEAGYRVVFPYRAGRGESDPHPFFLSLARDGRDCWALLDHLGARSVTAVGHSQGAYVAREMLLTQPERIDAIVTEDSSAFGTLVHDVPKAGVDRFAPPTRALYEKWRETLEFIGREFDYPSDYNVLRLLKRRALLRKEDEWRYQQVPDPDDARVPNGKYCRAPALVFAAGRGRIHPDDPEVEALRRRLPVKDPRLVVVTESGHAIHEEQFEVFRDELLRFLADTEPAD